MEETKEKEKQLKISQYMFRYIVPFGFDKNGELDSYNAIVKKISGEKDKNTHWEMEQGCILNPVNETEAVEADDKLSTQEKNWYGGTDIYEYLEKLYLEPGKNSIGSIWTYKNKNNFPVYKYIWKANEKKHFPEIKFYVHITNVGMYLLKTGIGLFWFEVTLKDYEGNEYIPGIRELTYFQNRFKELAKKDKNNAQRYLCFEQGEQDVKCCIGEWINTVLSKEVSEDSFYYPGRERVCETEKKMLPDKAILYNYVLTDGPDNMDRIAYYLTMGYHGGYRCNKEALDRIEYPFENEMWYASKEGCGCYAYCDSKFGSYFFQQYLPLRMKSDYFLMFMHLLQQSYSIMQMNTYIAKNVSAESQNDLEILENIEEKINRFIIKNVNASVSHIGHHNTYYRYVEKSLLIKEDMEAISQGVETLGDILRRHESNDREKSNERMQRAFALLTIIGIVELKDKICTFLKIDCANEISILDFWNAFATMSAEEKWIYYFTFALLLVVLISSASILWQWLVEVAEILVKLPVNFMFFLLELPAKGWLVLKKLKVGSVDFFKKKIAHLIEIYKNLK